MPQTAPTLAQETVSAARGMLALVIGDKRAPGYFDLTVRGLAGAALAFLLVVALTHYGPLLLGAQMRGGVGRSAILLCFIMSAQLAGGVLLLRFVRRSDAIAPFLTTTLWASLFVSVASFFTAFSGLPAELVLMVFGLVLLAIEINIGRVIVTLPPLQVAGLVAAQLLGSFLGLTVGGSFLPVPADLALSTPPA